MQAAAADGEFQRKRKDLHIIFVELEKDCDRVPRQELWNCRRLKEIGENTPD